MKEFILAQNELKQIFSILPDNGIILLQGELSSGKTSFVQEFLKYKGIEENAHSPTFSVMQKYIYKNAVIYHYDIYQEGLQGILKSGLFENFFEEGLHFVEWGDESLQKALEKFGIKVLNVKLSIFENQRKYKIYE